MSAPKLEVMDALANVAKALGHPHRLNLLEHVAQGERSVELLAQVAGMSFANTSQHLLQLRRGGLVLSRRDGKRVLYRFSGAHVTALLEAMRVVGERNVSEVQQTIAQYFTARDSMEPVSVEEMRKRVRKKSVVVLDVRPSDEFALGHFRSAVNIPMSVLGRRIRELPRNAEIIAYCRGPYCVLAVEAVALLRKHGYSARRLDGGYPELAAAGMPIA